MNQSRTSGCTERLLKTERTSTLRRKMRSLTSISSRYFFLDEFFDRYAKDSRLNLLSVF